MSDLPYLQELFQKLRIGYHLSPDDGTLFSALFNKYEAYAQYFAPLGLKLVRHPREFFYFEPENTDTMRDTLPRIAVFSFILIDDIANSGKPVEEYLLNNHFLLSKLPHFSLDRYTARLREVGVEDDLQLLNVLRSMEKLGWVKFLSDDEFRFLRPFHRVFDKCLELSKIPDASTASDGSN